MRPRREVIADWAHAVGRRVPLVAGDRGGYEFGEPAVAYEGERARYGVTGWDPNLRWVLVLDEPREEPHGEPDDTPDGEPRNAAKPQGSAFTA